MNIVEMFVIVIFAKISLVWLARSLPKLSFLLHKIQQYGMHFKHVIVIFVERVDEIQNSEKKYLMYKTHLQW